MESFRINIVIAGRTYPISVSNTKHEEGMRKAAKTINSLISVYEENYAVSDKQDVLAMCALQFASKMEIDSLEENYRNNEAIKSLEALTKLVNAHLN